jgi:hypothetical protein
LVSIFFELCFPNLFNPTWDDDLHLSGMGLTQSWLNHPSLVGSFPWLVASPFMHGLASFLMYSNISSFFADVEYMAHLGISSTGACPVCPKPGLYAP